MRKPNRTPRKKWREAHNSPRIGMRYTTKTPKRSVPSLWPTGKIDSQIKELFNMPPVKSDQAEQLPKKGGVFLITDSDGFIHVRTSKSIREHAERVCSTNPKSDLAQAIALRRTGIETFPSPNGEHTKKHLFKTNIDLIDAKRLALQELPFCEIRYAVEEDEDHRALLKKFVDMHLSDMEWTEQNAPKGKYRKRLIGLAKN
jgi:hypothetical protein